MKYNEYIAKLENENEFLRTKISDYQQQVDSLQVSIEKSTNPNMALYNLGLLTFKHRIDIQNSSEYSYSNDLFFTISVGRQMGHTTLLNSIYQYSKKNGYDVKVIYNLHHRVYLPPLKDCVSLNKFLDDSFYRGIHVPDIFLFDSVSKNKNILDICHRLRHRHISNMQLRYPIFAFLGEKF